MTLRFQVSVNHYLCDTICMRLQCEGELCGLLRKMPGGFPEHCTIVAKSDKAQKYNIYSVGPKTGVFVLGHKTSLMTD